MKKLPKTQSISNSLKSTKLLKKIHKYVKTTGQKCEFSQLKPEIIATIEAIVTEKELSIKNGRFVPPNHGNMTMPFALHIKAFGIFLHTKSGVLKRNPGVFHVVGKVGQYSEIMLGHYESWEGPTLRKQDTLTSCLKMKKHSWINSASST